jgi:hypothetical protein
MIVSVGSTPAKRSTLATAASLGAPGVSSSHAVESKRTTSGGGGTSSSLK